SLLQDPKVLASAIQRNPAVIDRVPAERRNDPQVIRALIQGQLSNRSAPTYDAVKDNIVASLRTMPQAAVQSPQVAAQILDTLGGDLGSKALRELGLGPRLADPKWMASLIQTVRKGNASDAFGLAPDKLKQDPAFQREAVRLAPDLLGKLAAKHGINEEPLRS